MGSKKYGVSVNADGKRIEVNSYQQIFRNKATGLCGDLNGERTADVKSFMIEDGKCKGIAQQRCVKKEEIPTRVSSIIRSELDSNRQPELRHITEEIKGETCFSKNLIRVCSRTYPKEIKAQRVEFTCIAGSKVESLKRQVQAGELVEQLTKSTTSSIKIVYVPTEC